LSTPGEETRSVFESTPGGVMTVEVGAITGELEVATRPAYGALEARVRYVGAEEWYTVDGGPVALEGNARSSLPELHEGVLEHLLQPGPVIGENEQPTSLKGFSLTSGDA
jgi:hypothetical protein